MDMIWMKHPALPDTQLIHEPVESVIGHQTSGWQVTDPPDPPPEETPPEGLTEESTEGDSSSQSSRRSGRSAAQRGTHDEGKE